MTKGDGSKHTEYLLKEDTHMTKGDGSKHTEYLLSQVPTRLKKVSPNGL